MVKVHLFYVDNYIYAFTATKELAKKFMKQRWMKSIVHRVEKMEDKQWSLFSSKHSSLMLIDNPYDTKSGYTTVVTTYGEDEAVSAFITTLEDARDECLSEILVRVGFKKKINKILQDGFNMIYQEEEGGGIDMNLSALSILIYLFEPTFTGEGEIRTQRTVDFNLG